MNYVDVGQGFARGQLLWEDDKDGCSLDKVKKIAFGSKLTALFPAYSLSFGHIFLLKGRRKGAHL